MQKIVMVNTVATGSHGRIMRDLAQATSTWADVTIAYGRGTLASPGDIVIDSKLDVLSHVGITRALDRHARGSKHATMRFIKQLDSIKPDLLHLHNIHGYYLHAETLFRYIAEKRIPTVWTHHDCWALTGHCSHFVRAACNRWQEGCHDCPLKSAYPASYGLDNSRANWHWKQAAFTLPKTLTLVSPSRWLAGVVKKSYLAALPLQVIPNGVDLSLFRPRHDSDLRARFGIQPGRLLLLAVASPFDERKGFADTLALAKTLQGKAHVIMVGLTPKQLQELPENVTGLARTNSPDELVSLYAAADCLVNTTYEDTYPTVNMEAMACGTPVAVYAVGGATEQIASPCGKTAPVGDIVALASAAMQLGAEKASLTEACRQHAQTHFDRTQAIGQYTNLYESILGE